ncbi:MAG: DUF642 domain-containing protein [Rhodobacter sp.]|nr:DUF642 domain-containing protein [Rhodobacter sp.]
MSSIEDLNARLNGGEPVEDNVEFDGPSGFFNGIFSTGDGGKKSKRRGNKKKGKGGSQSVLGLDFSRVTYRTSGVATSSNAMYNRLFLGRTLQGDNLIVNGSFESANQPSGTWSTVQLEGWTNNGYGVEVWGGPFLGETPSDGNILVELDAGHGVDVLSQTVATEEGQEYQLTFSAQQRVEGSGDQIEVWFGGKLIDTITPTDDWSTYTYTVTGSGGDTLEFREPAGDNNSYGPLLDDVSLYAIEVEPHGRVKATVFNGLTEGDVEETVFDGFVYGDVEETVFTGFDTGDVEEVVFDDFDTGDEEPVMEEDEASGDEEPVMEEDEASGDEEPVMEEEEASGDEEPMMEEDAEDRSRVETTVFTGFTEGDVEETVFDGFDTGDVEETVFEGFDEGDVEEVVFDDFDTGDDEPVMEEEEASGDEEPVMEEEEASGDEEPVMEEEEASGDEEPVMEEEEASGDEEPMEEKVA